MEEQMLHNLLLKEAQKAGYTELEKENINLLYEREQIKYFLNRETRKRLENIKIEEDVLKDIYEKNKQIYRIEQKVKLDTIFMKDVKKAEEILSEINTKNFGEYKEKYDEKDKKEETENFIPLSYLQPQLAQIISSYNKKGIIKKLAYVGDACHIIYLKNKEEDREANYEEVREHILGEVQKNIYNKIYNELVEEIINKKETVIDKNDEK